MEWADRIECASDPCGASEDKELAFPKMLGGGTGDSPRVGKSGGCGDGTKTVFRTSLRPLLAVGLRGVGSTAPRVFAMFERVEWVSRPSSWIGSLRISSLNCG